MVKEECDKNMPCGDKFACTTRRPSTLQPMELAPAPTVAEVLDAMVSACAIGVFIGYLVFSKPVACAHDVCEAHI